MEYRKPKPSSRLALPIRLSGLLLLGAGAVGVATLRHMAGHPPTAADYAMALLTFVALTAGTAMAAMGGHLLDPVPLSPQWRPRSFRIRRPPNRRRGG